MGEQVVVPQTGGIGWRARMPQIAGRSDEHGFDRRECTAHHRCRGCLVIGDEADVVTAFDDIDVRVDQR